MLVLYNPKSNATGKPVLPMSLLALGAVVDRHGQLVAVAGEGAEDSAAG